MRWCSQKNRIVFREAKTLDYNRNEGAGQTVGWEYAESAVFQTIQARAIG